MTFYVAIVIIVELLMLSMTIHVLRYKQFNKEQKGWFSATFISIMFCTLSEYFVHNDYYFPSLKITLTILTIVQFSLAPVLGMLFAGALGLKNQGRIAAIYFAINLAMEISLAPFGLIFSFTDTSYVRGDLFFLYEVFYAISLVYLLVSLFFVGHRFKHRDAVTIVMVLVVLVGGIIPMTFFKLNVAYLAIGIAACLAYIFYNDLVQQDTKEELINNQAKLSAMQEHIISGLASLIESRDTETGEHVSRTSKYVRIIAENAKNSGVYVNLIDDHFIDLLYTLAPMHDVGKIVVSDQILKQPRKLTPEEYEEMKRHAKEGGTVVKKILAGIASEEYLNFASDIATFHHERWDGSGYPYGLKENEIPLAARIMAIADVFDALISKRCYKEAIPMEEAFKIIEEESGTHFDPKLAKVFLDNKDKIIAVYDNMPK